MDDRAGNQPPTDETAALAELERMRAQIELFRLERAAAAEDLDRFARSLKEPRSAAAPRVYQPLAAPSLAQPVAAAPTAPAQASVDAPPVLSAVAVASEPPAPPFTPGPRSGSTARTVIAGAVILLAAGGIATWSLRHNAPQSAAPAPPSPAPSPASPPSEVEAAAPTETPVAAPSNESELTTVRRVWMRVIVDGERVLEREVPADTRVPLAAQKTIVIRTGDAGAVRLSIAGQDQGFLGATGDVVTRSFTVPPPQER